MSKKLHYLLRYQDTKEVVRLTADGTDYAEGQRRCKLCANRDRKCCEFCLERFTATCASCERWNRYWCCEGRKLVPVHKQHPIQRLEITRAKFVSRSAFDSFEYNDRKGKKKRARSSKDQRDDMLKIAKLTAEDSRQFNRAIIEYIHLDGGVPSSRNEERFSSLEATTSSLVQSVDKLTAKSQEILSILRSGAGRV
jgi:hypothetical protein